MKKIKFDTKKFIVYFIAFIMITSVFGIVFSGYRQQSASLEYNNIKFVGENNKWSANINNKKLFFDYHPEEVEFINVSSEITALLKNTYEIDVTSDANSTFKDTIALAEYSMSGFLNDLNIYLRIGFTTDNEYDLPIIQCSNATGLIPVIYFKKSNRTLISLENNCVIAEARDDSGFIRIKDRLLYAVLDIIR